MEAAGTYGNLFTSMGMGQGESAQLSMRLVELAQDLSSFNNVPTDQALVALRAALVGEYEPMRALGIESSPQQTPAPPSSHGPKPSRLTAFDSRRPYGPSFRKSWRRFTRLRVRGRMQA